MKKLTHEQWLKKLKLKEISIHMGMFDYGINCVIGDYEHLNEYIQIKFDDPEFDNANSDIGFAPRGKCYYCPGYRPIIWIPRYPQSPREYATLAHESLHAMYWLQRWANFALSDDTEEVMTHGMSHIIATILESRK